jgi:hypothetical protein
VETECEFSRFLHVPDDFTRKFTALRAQNQAFADSAKFVICCFLASIPFLFLRNWIKQQLRIKLVVMSGLAAFLLSYIDQLNNLASLLLSVQNISADSSLLDYVLSKVLDYAVSSLLEGLAFLLIVGASEPLYRKYFQDKIALENLFSLKSFRCPEFLQGSLLGIGLMGILLAYQVLFYLLTRPYGFWMPLQVNNPIALENFCPAWDAIALGLRASFLEELGFRLFILAVAQKFLRSFWLANLFQAVVWGFAHCDYAVEPPYARGVELMFVGLLSGWIMKRYGILPLLTWHYGFDAFLSVIALFYSPSLWDKFMASAAMLPLLLFPLISLLAIRKAGPVAINEIANSTIESREADEPASSTDLPLPVLPGLCSKTVKTLLLLSSVLFPIGLFLPFRTVDPAPVVRINRQQAISIAQADLKANGIDTSNRESVALLKERDDCLEELQYLFQKVGFNRTKQLEASLEPRVFWQVQFFQQGDAQVFKSEIGPDGKVISSTFELPDDAEGKKLEQTEASKMALDILKSSMPKLGNTIEIRHVKREERSNRVDYFFEAIVPAMKIADAPFQITVELIGAHPSGLSKHWVLPEKWEPPKSLHKERAVQIATILIFFALLVVGISFSLQLLKENPINWKFVLLLSVFLVLVECGNQFNLIACGNIVTSPNHSLDTQLTERIISVVSTLLLTLLINGVLLIYVSACLSAWFPPSKEGLLHRIRQIASSKYISDALVLGLSLAAGFQLLMRLGRVLVSYFSPDVPIFPVGFLCSSEQFSPPLDYLTDAVRWSFITYALALTILKWKSMAEIESSHLFYVALALVACCYVDQTSYTTFLINVATVQAFLVLAYALVVKVGKGNVLSVLFAVYFWVFVLGSFWLIKSEFQIHSLDLIWCAFFLLLPFVPLVFCKKAQIGNQNW